MDSGQKFRVSAEGPGVQLGRCQLCRAPSRRTDADESEWELDRSQLSIDRYRLLDGKSDTQLADAYRFLAPGDTANDVQGVYRLSLWIDKQDDPDESAERVFERVAEAATNPTDSGDWERRD